MRIPRAIGRGEVGFNMTPMIDIVFQLIIFFLVSSHLARQESQLPLDLPRAGSGEEAIEVDRPRVTVNVLADGSLQLAGRRVSQAELSERLAREAADTQGQVEVRIRSDRAAPYRTVEPIMLAAAKAGVWSVTFSVYRPEDVR